MNPASNLSEIRSSGSSPEAVKKTTAVIERYKGDASQLIPILQDIQAEFYYLPKEALTQVSDTMGVPMSRVYGVATFFKAFSLKPRGKHIINVCLGTACHVRGVPKILDQIERGLGIIPGETTDDLKFTLETVNCMGCCALGPVIKIDDEYFGQMKADKIDAVLDKYSNIRD